jgi:nucleotide-binding universal stress UspA family protein
MTAIFFLAPGRGKFSEGAPEDWPRGARMPSRRKVSQSTREEQKETMKKTRAKGGGRRVKPARATGEKVIELVPALIDLKSILVPIDFSEASRKALHYAVRFAEQFGAKITVLTVVEPVATPDFAYHPLVLDPEKARHSAQARLETLCSKLRVPRAVLGRTLAQYGSPYAEICETARALKVDLIILTTHGYTGLKHVFLGSTAERVIRHAPCPVLTVREKEHEFV